MLRLQPALRTFVRLQQTRCIEDQVANQEPFLMVFQLTAQGPKLSSVHPCKIHSELA